MVCSSSVWEGDYKIIAIYLVTIASQLTLKCYPTLHYFISLLTRIGLMVVRLPLCVSRKKRELFSMLRLQNVYHQHTLMEQSNKLDDRLVQKSIRLDELGFILQ